MGADWTHSAPLPGGEIPNADYETFANSLRETYPWMPRKLVHHYGRLYGSRTKDVVGAATSLAGLGRHFGGNLYEAEARYLVAREWAQTAEDVLWRRTKHRLHLTEAERQAFADWFASDLAKAA
jgi:glycerol-3-phosphate dehydrogenase